MSMKGFIVGLILLLSAPVSLFSINSTDTENQWEGKDLFN